MQFQPDVTFEQSYADAVVFGSIDYRKLVEEYRTNGRAIGGMATLILLSLFENLDKARRPPERLSHVEQEFWSAVESGQYVSVINDPVMLWKAVAASDGNPANLVRNNMLGVGRSINASAQEWWQKHLAGYIVIDSSRFPRLRIRGCQLMNLKKMGFDKEISRHALDLMLSSHNLLSL